MNQRFRYIVVFLFLLLTFNNSFASGLRFNGSEHVIDERTSYDVFCNKAPQFSDKLDISFDISLLEPSHYGYIVRIKNDKANKIYNLSYYISGTSTLFKLNEEGGKNLITAKLNNDLLQKIHWFRMSIVFDLYHKSLDLIIHKQKFTVNGINLPNSWKPDICFGKSDYLIDVPSFAIKQLTISDNKQSYLFPLTESRGNVAHDIKKEPYGQIENPVWLINDVYYWSHKATLSSKNVAGYSFDAQEDKLYIFTRDSLKTYNVRTGATTNEAFKEKCPVDIFLGTNFLDSEAKKLYVYEVCNEKGEKGVSVAVLDLQTKLWTTLSYATLYMQLHHHSSHYDDAHKRFYIFGGFGGFGGFGNMQYSKSLFSYNFTKNKWDSLLLKGNIITPRYFSSMGYSKKTNSLYIFGGMGNESGEQVVGRKYYYDLHKINLKNNNVTKLWTIPWKKESVVPVRDMIIEGDSCFYTLCYPEHFSESFLKLYCFSLKNGDYRILGDSIPIRSDKIKTNANIYYSSNLNALFTIIQEFDNQDISSKIKIYSISFPPITYDELAAHGYYNNYGKFKEIIIVIGLFVIIIACILLFFILKRKKEKENLDTIYINTEGSNDYTPTSQYERTSSKPNGIYLFGEFRVNDRKNKDITYMFSSKLKQTFLVLLQYSYSENNGISSQSLSEVLWPDRSEEKVKNSRGVTINHLRKIIKELDGIELIYQKGLFKILINSKLCYCDYVRCIEMIEANAVDENLLEFVEIVKPGKFLKSINSPEFDSFKEDLERKLEPTLIVEAKKCFENDNPHLTLILCETIFYIDPINDEAIYYTIQSLIKMKMNDEAKKRYILFIGEYKKMIGEEYPHSFSDLLNKKKKTS